MKRIRISACAVVSGFAGRLHNTSGSMSLKPRKEPNVCKPNNVCDPNVCKPRGNGNVSDNASQATNGNRCGHNPESPRVFTPSAKQKRPQTITELMSWFRGTIQQPDLYKMLYFHLNEDEKAKRLIRSEFREMISMGCTIILNYYDVVTGEVGFRNEKGNWVSISYQTIANKLSVSLIRVKRFFSFMRRRGFIITVQSRRKDEYNKWRSNVCRKSVPPVFFIKTIGIEAWKKVLRFKEWVIKKGRKGKDQITEVSSIFTSLLGKQITETKKKGIRGIGSFFGIKSKPVEKPKLTISQNLSQEAYRLHKLRPEFPPSYYLKELIKNTP